MYEVSLNICNSYQVIERTRFCDYLCYKGDNLNNTHARVLVIERIRFCDIFELLMLQGG